MNKEKQPIVTIGGGSGQSVLLSGLRDLEGVEITAIVSMTDNGGSTGRLRSELGILPPGDILKCLIALSPYRESARKLLLERFRGPDRLRGHNGGNMLLAMLSKYLDSFTEGIRALSEMLDIRGTILPVSLDKAGLAAELTDGTRIFGERAINIPRSPRREQIDHVFLVPHHGDSISVYPPVIEAINRAGYIIIGPGDLYTSIAPGLMVPGVKEAIRKSSAKILYIINLMTIFGETHHLKAHEFVKKIEDMIGKGIDGIIYNTGKPGAAILDRYMEKKSLLVEIHRNDKEWEHYKLYASDLLEVSPGGIVRHDPVKLSRVLREIIVP